MIIKKINIYDFDEELQGHFSWEARDLLFEFLEETHTEKEPYELDAGGLSCQFTEYASKWECLKEHLCLSEDDKVGIDIDELFKKEIEEQTLILTNGTIVVIADF